MKTIYVRLHPKASSNRIGETRITTRGQEQLMVYVTALAENNKANAAMIQLLAKHFKVARSCVCIAQGFTKRNKRIVIEA